MAKSSGAGRKAVPTKLRALKGSTGNVTKNKKEPKPGKAVKIDPPDYLTKPAKEEWRRVAPILQRLGLFTELDAPALSAYCEAFARYVDAVERLKGQELVITYPTGAQAPNHLIGIINSSVKQMRDFMTEFGMTPSSRAKLQVDQPEPEDPRMDLL